jgi:hypothetical protein
MKHLFLDVQFCTYCGKFQVVFLCTNYTSVTSVVNIFGVKLEAALNDGTIHLLQYKVYSLFLVFVTFSLLLLSKFKLLLHILV